MHSMFRPRRLFVSGESALSDQGAVLWEELGRQLAAEEGLVVITGGLDYMTESPNRAGVFLLAWRLVSAPFALG